MAPLGQLLVQMEQPQHLSGWKTILPSPPAVKAWKLQILAHLPQLMHLSASQWIHQLARGMYPRAFISLPMRMG